MIAGFIFDTDDIYCTRTWLRHLAADVYEIGNRLAAELAARANYVETPVRIFTQAKQIVKIQYIARLLGAGGQ